MAGDDLNSRFMRALEWAHAQQKSFHIKDGPEGDVNFSFSGRGRRATSYDIMRLFIEEIEKHYPRKPPCEKCKSSPCLCNVPF